MLLQVLLTLVTPANNAGLLTDNSHNLNCSLKHSYCFLVIALIFTSQMPRNINKYEGKVKGNVKVRTKAVAGGVAAIINWSLTLWVFWAISYSSPLNTANSSTLLSSAVINSALWLAHCCCVLCCRWQRWSRGSSGSRQRARWITHSWPLTLDRTNWSSVPGIASHIRVCFLFLSFSLSLSFFLPLGLFLLLSVLSLSCLSFPIFSVFVGALHE